MENHACLGHFLDILRALYKFPIKITIRKYQMNYAPADFPLSQMKWKQKKNSLLSVHKLRFYHTLVQCWNLAHPKIEFSRIQQTHCSPERVRKKKCQILIGRSGGGGGDDVDGKSKNDVWTAESAKSFITQYGPVYMSEWRRMGLIRSDKFSFIYLWLLTNEWPLLWRCGFHLRIAIRLQECVCVCVCAVPVHLKDQCSEITVANGSLLIMTDVFKR